jgi:hypothetical protein
VKEGRSEKEDRFFAGLKMTKSGLSVVASFHPSPFHSVPRLILTNPLLPHCAHDYICDVGSEFGRSFGRFSWYCPTSVAGLAWPSVSVGSALVYQGWLLVLSTRSTL